MRSQIAVQKGHGLKTPASGFDPDRLDVEIFFQVLLAGLAAIAAHLVAAERYRRVHRLIAIHPDRARAKRLGDAMGFADVLGPDPAAQSERRRVGALGGTFLSHDGGMEENLATLPGLISRADAAFFPMDCVSHSAVGHIKKCCRDGHKPFTPLRTASVASFIAAIGHRDVFPSPQLAKA
jgi:hypothetical protein